MGNNNTRKRSYSSTQATGAIDVTGLTVFRKKYKTIKKDVKKDVKNDDNLNKTPNQPVAHRTRNAPRLEAASASASAAAQKETDNKSVGPDIVVTLEDLILKRNRLIYPESWTDEEKRDLDRLARLFEMTLKNGALMTSEQQRQTTIRLLSNLKNKQEYEALATNLVNKLVPILDRSQEPTIWSRPTRADETGLAYEKLGFHGTLGCNIESIIENGFRQPTKIGKHGCAVYTSRNARYSSFYCKEFKAANVSKTANAVTNNKQTMAINDNTHLQMFGCRVLAYSGELFGDIYAVKMPVRTLALCVFRFPQTMI